MKVKISARSGRRSTHTCCTTQKKDSPGKFYKSSVDNKPYFHKEETLIMNRQTIDEKYFYQLKSSITEKS